MRQFGSVWLSFVAGLVGPADKSDLELITQGGQLGQVGIVREGLAQAGLTGAKVNSGIVLAMLF